MSYAALARKAPVVSTSRARAAVSPAAGELRIGDANDPYEQEAERVADEVMRSGTPHRSWSLSNMGIRAPLDKVAPPIVHEVLESPGQPLDLGALDFFEPKLGRDLGSVRLHSDARAIESARTDRVANEAMSSAVRHHWSLPRLGSGMSLQRKCSCGGSGECAQCKQDQDNKTLRRKAAGLAGSGIAPPLVHEVLKSPGRPLDAQTRLYFEPRLGYDLSSVRLHTGARAAESARAVNALAYTVNTDIVFGNAQYAPWTASGQSLLAHELTHTIQQGAGPGHLGLQRQPDSEATNDEGQGEQESEARDGDTPVTTSPSQQAGGEDVEAVADLGVLAQNSPEEMQGGDKKGQGKGKDEKKPAAPPKITSIDVDLATQQMTVNYSDGSTEGRAISSGKGQPGTEGDPCKTQTEKNCTPEGDFKIVSKGNEDTQNSHGDAMAWYVELGGHKVIDGRGIGIHDSQPVGGGPRSHGCVRVGDSKADKAFAKKINQAVDGNTTVHIKGKAPTKPWGKKPAPKPSKPKGKK